MIRQVLYFFFPLLFTTLLFAGTETETLFLSGKGSDAPVQWDFMVTGGRNANVWSKIPVPSNWELQGFGTYNYGHDKNKADEKGLYRHTFVVPEAWAGKRIFIVFEGSMTDTEVKINGHLAGPIHQGAFYRFKYDITKLVKPGQENLLQVTVSKMSSNQSVNMAERQADYWVFGGIFRPVYLQAVPKEYIDWTAIDARADGSFRIDVYIGGLKSADLVEANILAADGSSLAKPFSGKIRQGADKVTLTTTVNGQKNWTAETPHLYYVDVTLKKGEREIHTIRERFGFRTITVREGKGIFLNGKRIVLKGCDRHSFWPTTGRALSRNRCRDDILTMKEMNMNAVRMSHYPPDSYFLDLCDELGLYVLDELAGWQKPPYDTKVGEKLVAEMVKRDVNHPSILFWDNGNEGGWNTELDDDFSIYDPQDRRVLHPWELHGGIDTDHYESYQSTRQKLQSGNIYMPTEFLHGLYDGGLGAGLDDYWKLMWGHPLTGGMFLWVFADEGVVRSDRNCRIDTDGNHAPDGILGPFHEREASFYTIKEIWSPVYIESSEPVPADLSKIVIENRYDFTNLDRCRFEWKLVRYADPDEAARGSMEIYRAVTRGPDIKPHTKGFLTLDLPSDRNSADALHLSAYDADNRELYTWKWKITPAQKIVRRFIRFDGAQPELEKKNSMLVVKAGNFAFRFSSRTGLLKEVKMGQHTIPFGNGPIFVASGRKEKKIDVKIKTWQSKNAFVISVTNHPDFDRLQWHIYGSGWLQLDYSYTINDKVDYMGISFDYPENRMNEMTWLGKGPYRVWKNRLKGQTIDIWHNTYKNFQVNTAWDYPEFVGYYADFNWVLFDTDDGFITLATDDDGLFMRVYSQKDGEEPRHSKMIWPDGDISFLHAIPAIGTKFKEADQYGPQSQKFQASGSYSATLYFYFGVPSK